LSAAIILTLMFFAAIAFTGAGVAYAVGRARELSEAEVDVGMRAVTLLLFVFGSVCTYVAVGFTGIFAFGGVVAWASYIFSAQRVGVFRLYSADDYRRADFLQRNSLSR
jgi:threonine/homoserine efflux transporter RhtA